MATVAVLGLGPSLSLYNPGDFEHSIGVNDIWRYHQVEAVVCVDKRQNFSRERMEVIDSCRPDKFYSQMGWCNTRPDFQKIEILGNYPDITCDLSHNSFQKSFCSPFIAVQIAFRWYDGTDIHLFGVDLVDHPNLKGEMCRRIKIHFINLKKTLSSYGCHLTVHGEGILKDI